MTLVEELLKADEKKADELATGIFKSHKLAKILGRKPGKDGAEPTVDVELREVKSRRLNDLASRQIDNKGNMDYSKTFETKLMMCVEGITNPNLKDKELQAHFGCDMATDLAEKLFGFEVNQLSDAIATLSGPVGKVEDQEEEIKN